jgi:hypothetical protein
MRTKRYVPAIRMSILLVCLAWPAWAPVRAAPRGAAGAAGTGGRAASIDLDLHQSPPSRAAPSPSTPTPAGALLTPPGGATAARYQLRPTLDGGYFYREPAFTAHVMADGTVRFSSSGLSLARDKEDRGRVADDRDPLTSAEPVTVGGGPGLHFDATDEYLRRLGKDPARDAKAAFLTGTFDLRMKMALDARSGLRRAALADLPARLDELWRDDRLTVAERRHLLHTIRDELGNGPNSSEARAIVRDFARRHLPPKEAASFR